MNNIAIGLLSGSLIGFILGILWLTEILDEVVRDHTSVIYRKRERKPPRS